MVNPRVVQYEQEVVSDRGLYETSDRGTIYFGLLFPDKSPDAWTTNVEQVLGGKSRR